MRAKVAKRLRREVWGQGKHPGEVEYQWRGRQVVADPNRQIYQRAKRKYQNAP